MKKITKITAIATLAITLFTSTASAVKMYSPDGRTASVMEQDVAAWKAKGWSTKNYKTMYAADGRSEKVLLTDVAAWKKVGWYEVPVTVMYSSINGSTMIVANSEIEAYRKVGWQQFHEHFYGKSYKYINNYFGGLKYSFYFAGGDFYNPGSSEIYFGFPCAYPASSSSYKCSGLYIPISMIHTDLMKYADNNGNISKRAFDKHIGITTRLGYDDFESQSHFIYYQKNGLDFWIYCDYDGSFSVNDAYCDINKAG